MVRLFHELVQPPSNDTRDTKFVGCTYVPWSLSKLPQWQNQKEGTGDATLEPAFGKLICFQKNV